MSEQASEPWFDLDEGVLLIGDNAVQRRFEEGAVNLMPLGRLIIEGNLEGYEFERLPLTDIPSELAEAYGQWLMQVLSHHTDYHGLSRSHMRNGATLGILPADKQLYSAAGVSNTSEYKRRIGAPNLHILGKFDNWTEEDWAMYAKEVTAELGRRPTGDDYDAYSRRDLSRYPLRNIIIRSIGINRLNELIGYAPDRGRFDCWGIEEFHDYAKEVEAWAGKRPTENEYKRYYQQDPDRRPSLRMIERRISVGELDELLGYPNVKSWLLEDYIEWGARVMAVNGGLIITPRITNVLAHKRRGPSDFTIRQHFGTWSNYKTLVLKRYQEDCLERARKVQEAYSMIDEGKLPVECQVEPERILLKKAGLVKLAGTFLPHLTKDVRHAIGRGTAEDLFERILKRNVDITLGHIETKAIALGIFDDILPMKYNEDRHLRLHHRAVRRCYGSREPKYFDEDPNIVLTVGGEEVAGQADAKGPNLYRLGRVIYQKRLLSGHTRREFAKRINVGEDYLGEIEQGISGRGEKEQRFRRPSPGVVTAIARGLELDPDTLLELAGHAA